MPPEPYLASIEWGTPQDLFDRLNAEFGPFYLDAAASDENHKCNAWFNEKMDGLTSKWPKPHDPKQAVWLNPPYGRGLTDKWVKKAYEESLKGLTVCCLLPAWTDRKWWHEYVEPYAAVKRFLPGRVKFVGKDRAGNVVKGPGMFASVVVVFRPPAT